MNIQLGRGKTARRAYGIDEIALVPGPRTLDPELADTRWTLGNIEREIPIIASAMDGVIDVRMAVELAKRKITVNCVAPRQLGVERFLPLSPMRLLVDARGKDLAELVPHERRATSQAQQLHAARD